MKRLWLSGALLFRVGPRRPFACLLLAVVACGGDTVIDGTGGAAGSTGSNGSGASGSGGATSTGSTSDGSGGCAACDDGGNFFTCCDDTCVNTDNDPLNCGECGNDCPKEPAFCNNGICEDPPCDMPLTCGGGGFCCGAACCDAGQLCCVVQQGPVGPPQCYDPVDGTCPKGNPGSVCAAPETPIATPSGERRIAELRAGDLVYSVHRGRVEAVAVARVSQRRVAGHAMMTLRLAGGRTVRLSAPHPTADGRTIGELHAGDTLQGVAIETIAATRYDQPFTYDLLPASDTGTYFAAGALIGSTLFGWQPTEAAGACFTPPVDIAVAR